jgi:hypothetical protein
MNAPRQQRLELPLTANNLCRREQQIPMLVANIERQRRTDLDLAGHQFEQLHGNSGLNCHPVRALTPARPDAVKPWALPV